MHDLAEHTSTLLSIIGALVTIVGFMIWKKLSTIEIKVERNATLHSKCREELPLKFVTKEKLKEQKHDFKDWQKGRKEIWDAVHNHEHDTNGKVVR